MPITLIYTARQMNLTIDLSGVPAPLDIVQMGDDGLDAASRSLSPGTDGVIPVSPGVFKVRVGPGVFKVKSDQVRVTADTTDPQAFLATTVETKDPPPDPPMLRVSTPGMPTMTVSMAKAKLHERGVDPKKLHAFVVDARSFDLS